MNQRRLPFALTLLLGMMSATSATAQVYVVTGPAVTPYVPLSSGTVLSLADMDDGQATVSLPFAFPYYGQTYNSVTVNANGVLFLNNSCSFGCYTNTVIPSTTRSFHNLIAPWWDDLRGYTNAVLRTANPSPTEWVVEFSNWSTYGDSASAFSFQVKLISSGVIQFHYGSRVGSGGAASVGIEDQTGANGVSVLACGATCNGGNWPTDSLYTIGRPVQPELFVSNVSLLSVVNQPTTLSFGVRPTFQNVGQNTASNFLWRAYLSTNKVKDNSDTLIFTSTTPLSVSGGGSANDTGSVLLDPKPGPGQYYVLVEVDHTNAVAEAIETNNLGTTTDFFTQGIDLVAKAVSGPALSGPGNAISVAVNYVNQGTDAPAGAVQYKILLSADTTADLGDFTLFTGTKSVSGGQTINETVSVTVPPNVPGGEFHYILQLDSSSTVTEASEANNAVASAVKVKMEQADLVAEKLEVIDSLTGLTTTVARIGDSARFRVVVRNIGGANSPAFKISIAISNDNNLSLLSDTIVVDQSVTPVGSQAVETFTFDVVLPTKDKANKDYTSGNYYLFAISDSLNEVTELNEKNNTVGLGSIALKTPAPDYSVVRVSAPTSAAAGEVVPVYRVLKNGGNLPGASVDYRFFASANDIVTTSDLLLEIVASDGTSSPSGNVSLAAGAEDVATQWVKLPETMAPGNYFIGCLVDSQEQLVELDEANNANIAPDLVAVVGSTLAIVSSAPVDAMVGRPYQYRLVAAGTSAAVAWSVKPGAGTLPEGIGLSGDGTLSGTPTREGVSSFVVVASSAGRTIEKPLVLRVLSNSGTLVVTSKALPPLVNSPSVAYEASLGAAGGVKPYRWQLLSGSLPAGVTLGAEGTLSGKPAAGTTLGERSLDLQVSDALGSQATATVKLRVVEAGALVITTLFLPDERVNTQYLAWLSAENVDKSPVAGPLSWKVVHGTLPQGLTLRTGSSDSGILEGTPVRAGDYSFSIQVEDAKGRFDSIDYLLRIFPTRFAIIAPNLPVSVRPGEKVEFEIKAAGRTDVLFDLYTGQLPDGLTLSSDGKVTGTVASDEKAGLYDFVVQGRDTGGNVSWGVFSLEVVDPDKAVGCASASGSVSWLWALFLSTGWLVRLRRKASVPAAIFLGVVLSSVQASAQSIAYELKAPVPSTYVPLVAGTSTALTSVSVYRGELVSLPFSFPFFSETVNSLSVAQHGYVVFRGDDSSSYNDGIPSDSTFSYYPLSFIAPWWDDLTRPSGGSIRYQTSGAAPRRVFTVEWSNVVAYGPRAPQTKFSFQLSLYEGTGQIRFHYGPTAPGAASASVGLQEAPELGLAALSCTTASSGTCGPSNFPTNQVIDFFLPGDLMLDNLSVDPRGYAGVNYKAYARVKNTGGRAISQAIVRFYLSSDNQLDPSDLVLGNSTPFSLEVDRTATVSASGVIPANTVPGTFFVFAVADPDSSKQELSRANNQVGPAPVLVSAPLADVVVGDMTGPTNSSAGSIVSLQRTVSNIGSAPTASGFPVTYFLSENSVVTVSDRPIYTETVSALASQATDTSTVAVTLPNDLAAGRYWLGACVDYDPATPTASGVSEISEANNCGTAAQSILVSAGSLAVLDSSLPAASQFAPYSLRLLAVGGNGSYQWELSAGALSRGMSLSAQGDLTGIPQEPGTFRFTATVQSGGSSASADLQLDVSAAGIPLALAEQDLQNAELGRGYEGQLVAVGGRPPYLWALQQTGRLPGGIALSNEGKLEGRPLETGDFTFGVSVKDQSGAEATRTFRLKVLGSSRLQVAISALPTAVLGKEYSAPLLAVGASGSLVWSVVRFQEVTESPTEQPAVAQPTLPANFGLNVEPLASGQWLLKGVPTYAGLFALTFQVEDPKGSDLATLLLRVSYEEALAITTLNLPDAFVGVPYDVRLGHNAGNATDVVFRLPCLYEVNEDLQSSQCATVSGSTLPLGLSLDATGRLSGMPTEANTAARTYTFLVQASDSKGRKDVRALSLRLRTDVDKGGCSHTGQMPSLAALFTFLVLSRLSRRKSSLSANRQEGQ